ncbi:MAG: septum formation initiator family protein [Thermodesulfovibrionales bacterium]|nr:septum formation initiator family protein [Thermodesulfovibrionales bacterium]
MRGSSKVKSLRQQIEAERRRKNIFFYSVVALFLISIIVPAIFGERGLVKYYELKKVEKTLKTEIHTLQQNNDQLRREISQLKNNSFLREKYAREDYRLAKPGEYIYYFKNNNNEK